MNKQSPENPTPEQQARHDRRHPEEGAPRQPKPGHVLVSVTYHDGRGHSVTRQRNIRSDIAALFSNGGVDVAKFNALSAAQQWDACQNDDDVRNAILMNCDRTVVGNWFAYCDANDPLPADGTKAPTSGLSGVLYP